MTLKLHSTMQARTDGLNMQKETNEANNEGEMKPIEDNTALAGDPWEARHAPGPNGGADDSTPVDCGWCGVPVQMWSAKDKAWYAGLSPITLGKKLMDALTEGKPHATWSADELFPKVEVDEALVDRIRSKRAQAAHNPFPALALRGLLGQWA